MKKINNESIVVRVKVADSKVSMGFELPLKTKLCEIGELVCNNMNCDAIFTELEYSTTDHYFPLKETSTLLQNSFRNYQVLFIKFVNMTNFNEKVSYGSKMPFSERYGYITSKNTPIATKGLTIEGKCDNPKCHSFDKEVILTHGTGKFNLLAIFHRSKCTICPHKGQNFNKQLKIKDAILSNCLIHYEGEYQMEDDHIFRKSKEKAFRGEDRYFLKHLYRSKNWIKLQIKVKPL